MSLVGNLADLCLTDIFQIVSLSKRTGLLNIANSKDKASITFMQGNVIKASSTTNRTNLGSLLKKKGRITDKDEARTLAIQKQTREPFGTVLVRENIIPRAEMETILKEYIQNIVVELLEWEDGHFDFELLSSPKELLPLNGSELILEHGIDTQHLVIEGLRILDEERHRNREKQRKKQGIQNIGFSSLMEEPPISLSEPGPGPEPASHCPGLDSTGHPEGLWESIQDEIRMDESEAEEPTKTASPPEPARAAAEIEEPRPQDVVTATDRSRSSSDPSLEKLDFLHQLALEVGEDFVFEEADAQAPDDISSLKSMVEELKAPNSLSEVLLLILRYASQFFGRSALFIVREGEIRGFGQFGLDGEEITANDRVRSISLPEDGDCILCKAVRLRAKVQGPLTEKSELDEYILKSLGSRDPKEFAVIPVISNNRPIALLYGDNGRQAGSIQDIEALEIFIIQAGFVLDRSLLESKLQDLQA